MAELTHVSGLTSENRWVRMRAEDVDIDKNRTVSARSGLFRCDLCGQPVTLTKDSSARRRHFRHSPDAIDKNCPERSSSNSNYSTKLNEHTLPLRINLSNTSAIHFEIGFIRLPEDLYDKLSITIILKAIATGQVIDRINYNHERFFHDSITYLDVGTIPTGSYELKINNDNKRIRSYWPTIVPGIDSDASLFEISSGLMKPSNSDIVVGKEYYFLTNRRLFSVPKSVQYKQLSCTKGFIPNQFWTLYKIKVTDFSDEAVHFFLRYSYRLVENDVLMQPIWPLFQEGPFSFLHNHEAMYVFFAGEGDIDYYPKSNARSFSAGSGKVAWFHSLERQQLMSIGQYKTLAYSYYWKTELNKPASEATIDVIGMDGELIHNGENQVLPHSKSILITSKYFGYVEKWKKNQLVNKQTVTPSSKTMVTNISYGETLKVFVGLDCVWSASFIKINTNNLIDELEIVRRLNSYSHSLIPAPHSLKRIAVDFHNYPTIQSWIRKAIKNNQISQQSYRLLQELHRKLIVENQ